MDSLISKNRGFLIFSMFASLGVFLHSLPDLPDPTIEGTSVRDFREERIEVAPEAFVGIYRQTTRVYVDNVSPDKVGYQEPKPPPHHHMVYAEEAQGLKLMPSPYSVSALPHPASVAETAYVMFWEEFIGDMNLSDEPAVRAIITEWHQFNLELIFAQQEGHITIYELAQSILSVEDLQARLAPYLTASQLIDIEANFEAFMEYVAGEHA